jgi:hypothetical protein
VQISTSQRCVHWAGGLERDMVVTACPPGMLEPTDNAGHSKLFSSESALRRQPGEY